MRTQLPALLAGLLLAASAHAADAPPQAPDPAHVAILTYGQSEKDKKPMRPLCFAPGFLTVVDRDSSVRVARKFDEIHLLDARLFDHPFVILSGEGAFTLDDREKAQLKAYVSKGGFILASTGCSSAPWAQSFRKIAEELWGKEALAPLPMSHPVFHAFYEIEALVPRKPGGVAHVYGIAAPSSKRLSVVFSDLGLNDTDAAGGGCCCCGANEVRNAREVNANLLVHALTH